MSIANTEKNQNIWFTNFMGKFGPGPLYTMHIGATIHYSRYFLDDFHN